jgi:hypothetical protein
MRSETQIKRYIKVLEKNTSKVEAYNMIRALNWVLNHDQYPTERDLNIAEEVNK